MSDSSTALDLSRLWEEDRHEFAMGDTEATLATMVDDAYVNHIPVLTGGHGKQPCAISIAAVDPGHAARH